jgi:hypothetical protein
MPDLMAELFGGGLGGGAGDEGGGFMESLGGLSESDARNLSLIQAIQQTQKAGLQRTATPIGAIANALLPLVVAPIAARQARMESMKGALPILLQLAEMRAKAEDRPLERRTKEAQASKAEQEAAWKKKLIDMAGGAMPEGMEVTGYGVEGLQIGRGRLLSPEEEAQQMRIYGAKTEGSSKMQEDRAKRLEVFKRSLPPAMGERAKEAVTSGRTLLELLNDAEAKIASIPKDISDSQLSREAAKYQMRSEHPALANVLKGYTGGMVTADTDPRLDDYFNYVGQVEAALTSFNLSGMRGGIRTIDYLRKHFPGFADNLSAVLGKTKALRNNKSVVSRSIENHLKSIERTAATAEATPGGEAEMGWVGRPIFDKNGNEKRLWLNEQSGESLLLDPGQAPPLE